jgi:hypothetical protein
MHVYTVSWHQKCAFMSAAREIFPGIIEASYNEQGTWIDIEK